MPYELKKVKGGWKVQKKGGELMKNGRRYASDRPLTESQAKKQLTALHIQEETYKVKKFSPSNDNPDKKYKVCRKDERKLKTGRYYSTNKLLTYKEASDEKKRLQKKDRQDYDSKN